jgi:hypothetical protein
LPSEFALAQDKNGCAETNKRAPAQSSVGGEVETAGIREKWSSTGFLAMLRNLPAGGLLSIKYAIMGR